MTTPILRLGTATVWLSSNGRRYFSRRAAVHAHARRQMRRGHSMGVYDDGYAPCWCRWCCDAAERGALYRRYVRFLMRCTSTKRTP